MMKELKEFTVDRLEELLEWTAVFGRHPRLSECEALVKIALAAKQADPVVNIDYLATEIMKTIDAETDKFHSAYTLSELRIAIVKTLSAITTPQPSHTEQDGWIKCSEWMPGVKTGVLVGCWFGREWASKWATFVPGSPESQISGWIIPGASWNPTHWMPLPAAPKQEK